MKVCFFGHGMGIEKGAKALTQAGHRLCGIVTHPRAEHEREAELHARLAERGFHCDVFEFAQAHHIPLHSCVDADDPLALAWIEAQQPDVLVSIGSRHIFRTTLLARFPNRVLNLHTSPLPRYRGGAGDSWMILNGLREASGVCHIVTGAIDAGPVISRAAFQIPARALPIDLFGIRMELIGGLLLEALQRIADPSFRGTPQDPSAATYFPRLQTEVDGWIDWSQSAEAIERHVRAFGLPYAGAFTGIRGGARHLRILEGEVGSHDEPLHPNATGLVFGLDGRGGVKIFTGTGVYVVGQIRTGIGAGPAERLVRLGTRFEVSHRVTPSDDVPSSVPERFEESPTIG